MGQMWLYHKVVEKVKKEGGELYDLFEIVCILKS